MNSILATVSTRLVRPGSVLLALTAVLFLWQGAASLPYAGDYDPGTPFFLIAVAGLYGAAGFWTWKRRRLGAWFAAGLIALWSIIGLRWGRLPSVAISACLTIGPVLALAAWQHLNQQSTSISLGRMISLVAAIIIVLGLAAPLWHCHEGFGGLADYHCHSVLVHGHVH